YVPRGVAHGFQTLTDDAEVAYAIDGAYEPSSARTIRWDSLAIAWPIAEPMISEKDRRA
ncbi:MAG TPA: dTDP-4-dehydrorhamnose 3,5-epimerase family protein, partial [Thermoanaerobaculia bacterium]|nr:dTDP-4-dehydrorhamnose 3,5-epimerase family protein [Thermoanaerobaculia bacterium]